MDRRFLMILAACTTGLVSVSIASRLYLGRPVVACRLRSVDVNGTTLAAESTVNNIEPSARFPAFYHVSPRPITCIEVTGRSVFATLAPPQTSTTVSAQATTADRTFQFSRVFEFNDMRLSTDHRQLSLRYVADHACARLNDRACEESKTQVMVTAEYSCLPLTRQTQSKCRSSFRPPPWLF